MPKRQRVNVTIKDVAKHAGVSTATVSRVLNGKTTVKDVLAKRVRLSVKELGYHPNAAARTLKTRKANAIGILVPDISNPYFMHVIKGIEDVIAPSELVLLMASSDESEEKERKLLSVLSEDRIDCLVLATVGGNEKIIKDIHETSVPVVLIDRLPDSLAEIADSIVEDNFGSAYELTQRILRQGIRSLGIIHGPMAASTARQRAAGCLKAIEEYDSVLMLQEHFGDFSFESGVLAVETFVRGGCPDAIIAVNNLMAAGALYKLKQKGFIIGENILIGSYGDIEMFLMLESPFYYIEQTPRVLGHQVGKVIYRRLRDGGAKPITKVMKQPLLFRSQMKNIAE